MKVSVVIPVYNAGPYVEQAVASALAQPETGEVLLIEDGSGDDSLAACRRLVDLHDCVRLFRHPDGGNQGAGASRNLGVTAALCPLVAFLDADDYYLPARFREAMEVFDRHPDADGVYETTGLTFQDEESKRRHQESGWCDTMGLRVHVAPERLFDALARGGSGSFCTDGIVVRRSIFDKCGLFNPVLRCGQDTHLWIRMAAVGRLYPGREDGPVSMCRIHAGNRVTGRPRQNQMDAVRQVWADLVFWGRAQGLSAHQRRLLARRYVAATNGQMVQQRLPVAVATAVGACRFLLRACPQPWRVAGFFRLLAGASGVVLAAERLADGLRRRILRTGVTPA